MVVLRAVNFGPYLLSLPVGVLVDRTRRRPLLIGADLLRALLLGSIPLVAGVGVLLTPLWLQFSPVRSLRTVVWGVRMRPASAPGTLESIHGKARDWSPCTHDRTWARMVSTTRSTAMLVSTSIDATLLSIGSTVCL
jgi:hypothetical protein